MPSRLNAVRSCQDATTLPILCLEHSRRRAAERKVQKEGNRDELTGRGGRERGRERKPSPIRICVLMAALHGMKRIGQYLFQHLPVCTLSRQRFVRFDRSPGNRGQEQK